MSDTPNPNVETPAAQKPEPPAPPRLVVSSAPHLADKATTSKIMYEVILAMVPTLLFAIWLFRGSAVLLVATCVIGCIVAEIIANTVRKKTWKTVMDGSAIITGMILAFSLPPKINPYMAFIGSLVAIWLAKSIFGGLGQNLFNPAMVGRAFLMICFPAAMVNFATPDVLLQGDTNEQRLAAMTMPTPLYAQAKVASFEKALKNEKNEAKQADLKAEIKKWEASEPPVLDLFVGKIKGSLGETSTLFALIGGLYLLIRKIIDYRIVVSLLGMVTVFATIGHLVSSETFANPLYHLTSGALMFGTFFIATEYVGAPVTPKGRWIFGAGVGFFTMLIRVFGAYPEGFMFSILIMNACTPLIERWTRPMPYGGHPVTERA